MHEANVVELDLSEVHQISMDMLDSMYEVGIPHHMMLAALGMSLGRLSVPRRLEESEEAAFINAVLQFTSAYFATGRVN